MRVLVADRFSDDARATLAADGFDVAYTPDARGDALTAAISDAQADVLVVRSTRVDADMLRASRLKLVIRAGAGFNTIDVATARSMGIYVANCPGKNSNAVVEIAFGLIIALDRQIAANVADLQRGAWRKAAYSGARGLAGSAFGLVGVGRIGRAMIPRAKAFGMSVAGWSRSLTDDIADELGIARKETPADVAQSADIVSVHVSLNDDTRQMAGRDFFAAMREGAIFINTSRAEVVDESALAWAVRERGIKAGLDVFEGEPPSGTGSIDNPLFALDGVIGTHHIGGQTSEAQRAIADETVRIIREYHATGTPPNLVT
ncbi:MAG: hydroxyacid dehydrogenase [Chloroflexi bacterium]|nr:hydroxyacid dehydrogenase [Chloroflexota bacterium]